VAKTNINFHVFDVNVTKSQQLDSVNLIFFENWADMFKFDPLQPRQDIINGPASNRSLKAILNDQ
jgi:hypothetical protein